jgi:hypothetical protein
MKREQAQMASIDVELKAEPSKWMVLVIEDAAIELPVETQWMIDQLRCRTG